jgi:dTDP-6-deoxy-L-talose 4-dehydrogenase (NAD+)
MDGRVLVTGATGFVGRHVVEALLDRGRAVTVLCRDAAKAAAMPWAGRVAVVEGAIGGLYGARLDELAAHGRIMHLAWEGLPDYMAETQVSEVMPRHLEFLRELVARGARRLLVAGTCLEYGLVEGRLAEDTPCAPVTAYGRAKDGLRRALEPVCEDAGARLVWARLFYMHGPGQNPRSLLAQLDRAMDEGREAFDMSGGEQTRDYLPVAEAADRLARLALQDAVAGPINCCSGSPLTVRSLVETHMARRGASLRLNLGVYPYPAWEPMHFHGDTAKLEQALAAFESSQGSSNT